MISKCLSFDVVGLKTKQCNVYFRANKEKEVNRFALSGLRERERDTHLLWKLNEKIKLGQFRQRPWQREQKHKKALPKVNPRKFRDFKMLIQKNLSYWKSYLLFLQNLGTVTRHMN